MTVTNDGELIESPITKNINNVKHYFNRHLFPYHGKEFTIPSETIPDQSMSIREILDRYARGLPLEARTPIWDDNADENDVVPDPRTMDLSERQEFAQQAKQELEEIKSKIAEKKLKKPIVEPPIQNDPPISEQ